MNRAVALGLLAAAAIALALRCPRLDERPMHNDEAVNAVKFGQLWEHGRYRYDPNEHHGPSLYYATFALARLTSAPDYSQFTESGFRAITIVFGVGLILLLPLVARGLGKPATVAAGLLTAVSPAMVFYSRYYIHEMALIFFTFLAIAAGWRYACNRKLRWALLAGASLGLMHATKETFPASLGAAVLALALNSIWNRWIDATQKPAFRPQVPFKHVLAAFGAWVVVVVVLFSSFFTNLAGPLDSLRTYGAWLQRAGGDSPHLHPWSFYFDRLLWFHPGNRPIWTETLILLLAIAASVAAFRRKGLSDSHAGLVRVLALYTCILAVAYSALPYKTPWCLLSFWHGAILLAGVGAAGLIQSARTRIGRLLVTGLLVAGASHLAWQAWQLSVPWSANPRNPYVYAQTSPDLLNLVEKVEALATAHPQGHRMPVQVVAPDDDYWPLPWYLRRFSHVGWWNAPPADPMAPVMIISPQFQTAFETVGTNHSTAFYQLRPQVFLELYVERDLWRASLQNRPQKTE